MPEAEFLRDPRAWRAGHCARDLDEMLRRERLKRSPFWCGDVHQLVPAGFRDPNRSPVPGRYGTSVTVPEHLSDGRHRTAHLAELAGDLDHAIRSVGNEVNHVSNSRCLLALDVPNKEVSAAPSLEGQKHLAGRVHTWREASARREMYGSGCCVQEVVRRRDPEGGGGQVWSEESERIRLDAHPMARRQKRVRGRLLERENDGR